VVNTLDTVVTDLHAVTTMSARWAQARAVLRHLRAKTTLGHTSARVKLGTRKIRVKRVVMSTSVKLAPTTVTNLQRARTAAAVLPVNADPDLPETGKFVSMLTSAKYKMDIVTRTHSVRIQLAVARAHVTQARVVKIRDTLKIFVQDVAKSQQVDFPAKMNLKIKKQFQILNTTRSLRFMKRNEISSNR